MDLVTKVVMLFAALFARDVPSLSDRVPGRTGIDRTKLRRFRTPGKPHAVMWRLHIL